MRLVIASRKSDLARIQSLKVGKSLSEKNPQLKIEYHWRESLGDINLQDPLWKMPEKGVFTEDFHQGLVSGEFDMVVHSWKDLPTEDRQGTLIAATLPREDVRDVLLFKKKDLSKKEINILTSSPRRIHNLQKHLPLLMPRGFEKIDFSPVRGNVQTRVRKLMESTASGLVVAKAALDRLLDPSLDEEFQETQSFLKQSLEDLLWMVLPISLNPPAAAQGALAIEICNNREDLKEILKSIHCDSTFQAVLNEREMLKSWGGGCHQKIGVCILPRPYGTLTSAQGERDTGERIDLWHLDSSEDSSLFTGDYFPTQAKESLWFDREKMAVSSSFKNFNAHWVSKAEAFPESVQLSSDHLIWTSGVKTWMTLASRGCWVNGSSESLGEREDERLHPLDQKTRQWCKWTHDGGEENKERTAIKTYKLTPKKAPPLISEKTEHFFWMSGSSFREALRHYPWLVNKKNWSGPGLTSEALAKEIKTHKGSGSVHIALSFEQWQKSFISSKGRK